MPREESWGDANCHRETKLHGERRRKRRKPRRQSVFTPRLESLEDRHLLSTFTVVNTADSGIGSLRDAIDLANSHPGADEIRFANDLQGSIDLTSGQLVITDDLTIRGPGAQELAIRGSGDRAFAVVPAGLAASGNLLQPPTSAQLATAPAVTIERLSIEEGTATNAPGLDPSDPANPGFSFGGGLYNLGGDVRLDRVRMVGNQATGVVTAGGAVANEFGGTLTVYRSDFEDNASMGVLIAVGGAITSDLGLTADGATSGQPQVIVDASTFTANRAEAFAGHIDGEAFTGLGGGGAILNVTGVLTVTRSHFEDNSARGGMAVAGIPGLPDSSRGGPAFGGAILSGDASPFGIADSSLDVRRSTFVGNTAQAGGSGVPGIPGGQAGGGAINVDNGSDAELSKNVFRENAARGGGGGPNADGGIATGGGVAAAGGAFLTQSQTTLALERNRFLANVAEGGAGSGTGYDGVAQGGGLGLGSVQLAGFFPGTAAAVVSRDVYQQNQSLGGLGGGIYNEGTLQLERSVLTGNEAVGNPNSVVVTSAVASIAGGASGGGIANSGRLTVHASSFEGNAARGADDVDASTTSFPNVAFPGAAFGGGIANFADASIEVHIDGSRFTANVAEAGDRGLGDFAGLSSAGAVYNDGALRLSNSQFRGNESLGGDDTTSPFHNGHALGGALVSGTLLPVLGGPESAELIVTRSTFHGNRAVGGSGNTATLAAVPPADGPNSGYGGAILVYQGSAELDFVRIQDNEAIGGDGGASQNGSLGVGGGIFLFDFLGGVTAQLERVNIQGNRAIGGDGVGSNDAGGSGIGGGIAAGSLGSPFGAQGSVAISDSLIARNEARGGAGSGSGSGGLALGGGFANVFGLGGVPGGNTSFSDTSLMHNRAVGGAGGTDGNGGDALGGGVYNGAGAQLELVRDRVFGNLATGSAAGPGGTGDGEGFGGGIFNDGDLMLELTRVYGNMADNGDDLFPEP